MPSAVGNRASATQLGPHILIKKKKKLAPTARRSKRIAGVLEQRMMVEPLVPDQLQC